MALTLTLEKITKSYQGHDVLRGCSFSFDRPLAFALMGKNGCGKSTLLRICALIENPDQGDVIYRSGDTRLDDDMSLRRQITLVLPRIGLFNTTVYKNVAYGLSIRGMAKAEIERKVKDALNAVGLSHKRDQNARTLSSGESQRVGIARAEVLNPHVLFLDEPTAYVDQKSREIIEAGIMRMRSEGKTMVIFTTHDRSQAERISDRLLFIEEGVLIPA